MLLTEYSAKIVKVIEEYSKTHLITESGLSIELFFVLYKRIFECFSVCVAPPGLDNAVQ